MRIKKMIYIVVGCVSFILGAIGTILPILPTVPFFLCAAFCFARSSKRLNHWFVNTKLYKKNLESFVEGKGMTLATKLRIMGTVTVLMAIGFFTMSKVSAGRIVLLIVWICHVVYFVFGVKTTKEAV